MSDSRDDHLPSDPRDYVLDISTQPAAPHDPDAAAPPAPPATPACPYLSIHFKCCNVYTRIYPTTDRTAYAGHCPKCARPVRIKISPSGSTDRVFIAE